MVKIKRIYDPVSKDDGKRILVDRLWPRGVKKENAAIDEWLKDIAPSEGTIGNTTEAFSFFVDKLKGDRK